MEREQAVKAMITLLAKMKQLGGSDLVITEGFPPAMKLDGCITPLADEPLSGNESSMMIRSLMSDRQIKEFDATNESNFAICPPAIGRFRVSAYMQLGRVAGVLRSITTEVPTFEQLRLPEVLKEVVMSKRGLVLVVGATGSGKSTTLAAMIGHRNQNSRGHIITVEDPVEFIHQHRGCVVSQREIGADTLSWDAALKCTLRQAPDVIQIGEIRSAETMAHAINFSETGHLVLATLHANSANQALDRIINFFDEEKRHQVLMDLSLNLRAIISQRLLRREAGGRIAAFEIMLNSPLIADMIFGGDVSGIKDVMARSTEQGMITFDQCIFDLYERGEVGYEEALRHADSQNQLRLRVKLNSKRGGPGVATPAAGASPSSPAPEPEPEMQMMPDPEPPPKPQELPQEFNHPGARHLRDAQAAAPQPPPAPSRASTPRAAAPPSGAAPPPQARPPAPPSKPPPSNTATPPDAAAPQPSARPPAPPSKPAPSNTATPTEAAAPQPSARPPSPPSTPPAATTALPPSARSPTPPSTPPPRMGPPPASRP